MMRLFWHNRLPVFLPAHLLVLCFVLPLVSCHKAEPEAHYIVGVSIDFDDVWHNTGEQVGHQSGAVVPQSEIKNRGNAGGLDTADTLAESQTDAAAYRPLGVAGGLFRGVLVGIVFRQMLQRFLWFCAQT